jgi:hypothetical protein
LRAIEVAHCVGVKNVSRLERLVVIDSAQPQVFEIRPFSGAVGAEIIGLDLAKPVNAEDFAASIAPTSTTMCWCSATSASARTADRLQPPLR